MSWKCKLRGGIVGLIGFMLSPLSWWNDAFVNLPLALGLAWLVAWVYPPAFAATIVVGYWLTNVLGFVLMHKGASAVLSKEDSPYTAGKFARDILISLGYTLLIVVLLKLKVLQPLTDYCHHKS